MNKTVIFTDGASRGNPGRGGWGTVIVNGDEVIELAGREDHTTNNRMELKAVIEGLKKLNEEGVMDATVFCDSSYVIKGAKGWLAGWKRNGWKTKTKKAVLNSELWKELDEALSWVTVEWKLLGGHIGIAGNERCDQIATEFADGVNVKLYRGQLNAYPVKNILDVSFDATKHSEKKSSSAHSRMPAYSYVSAVKGKVMIHKTWAECEKRVKGVSGAKFKKAVSVGDEQAIIKSFS